MENNLQWCLYLFQYLKPIKPVWWSHCCSDASICLWILWHSIIIWFWRFFRNSQQEQWLQSYLNGDSFNQQISPSNNFHEKVKLVTNVYWKKTFSSVYTNFNRFIPETYKAGLIKSLLFRCFNLCLDFVKFYHKINFLQSNLFKNNYHVTSLTNSLQVRLKSECVKTLEFLLLLDRSERG